VNHYNSECGTPDLDGSGTSSAFDPLGWIRGGTNLHVPSHKIEITPSACCSIMCLVLGSTCGLRPHFFVLHLSYWIAHTGNHTLRVTLS
jgi:hypothetical protein